MADDFTYSIADNRITQANGTAETPLTFADMYDADMAGSVELLAATAGADNLTLTYQVQPADSKALKIDFVVASKTAEADYIHITGTDAWGNAQSETIYVLADLLGNQLVNSANWIVAGDWEDESNGGSVLYWLDQTQTGSREYAHQSISITDGNTYRVTFTADVTQTQGSDCRVYLGDEGGAGGQAVQNGANSFDITAGSSDTYISFGALSGQGVADIDEYYIYNISVKLITPTSNGTYTTTKYFATITDIDCNDSLTNSGGTVWADGTVAVNQNQWGIIHEIIENGVYKVDCDIYWGNGTDNSYFESANEHVWFDDNRMWQIQINGNLQLGEKTAGDHGIYGSNWNFGPPTGIMTAMAGFAATMSFKMYGSHMHRRTNGGSGGGVRLRCGVVDIRDSIFSGETNTDTGVYLGLDNGIQTLTVKNLINLHVKTIPLGTIPSLFEGVQVFDSRYGIQLDKDGIVVDQSFSEEAGGAGTYGEIANFGAATAVTVRDIKSNISSVFINSDGSSIIDQKTCNIHITDEDGNNLNGVTVDCQDKDGNYVWTAGSVTTDTNGEIAEQVINYRKWEDTSETLTTYSPHKFTFTKSGYVPQVYENVTTDGPINWQVTMQEPKYIRGRSANMARLGIIR
jgi:hypothetical protein